MQLFIIDWTFQNAEDQLFATNEFCEYIKQGKLNQHIEGFDLNFIAHTPQNGSGIIICKAYNMAQIYNILKIWRENFSITFNIKPALTNEELLALQSSNDFWEKD